jgi:hypothetical protein
MTMEELQTVMEDKCAELDAVLTEELLRDSEGWKPVQGFAPDNE